MYKVREVARLAGISVRALHHYDSIGLLKPAEIGDNGYRLYSEEDLSRLQQILFFKELDFALDDVKRIMDHPGFDRKQALLTHKQLLELRRQRLDKLIHSVDATIRSMEGGSTMSKESLFEPFDMKQIEEHQQKYAKETERLYGNTDAYKQSKQRTSRYTEDDWKRIKAEADGIYKRLVAAMPKGPADEETQSAIAAHRQHITDNYYTCTLEIYRGLGDMYVNDPRFTKNIDKYQEGLAEFFRQAIHLYCDRAEQAGK
ncbi:MAG: MerR family transcriptional regulator [Paenibacillus sp.]|nr:MerR family transcriptional regulator [Paenibacillus sp.]